MGVPYIGCKNEAKTEVFSTSTGTLTFFPNTFGKIELRKFEKSNTTNKNNAINKTVEKMKNFFRFVDLDNVIMR